MNSTDAPRFPTINQTAKICGIPNHLLRKMLADGELPGFYSGNRFHVNLKQLDEKLDTISRTA